MAARTEFGEEMLPELCFWDEMRDTAVLTADTLRRNLSLEDLLAAHAYTDTPIDFEPALDHAVSAAGAPDVDTGELKANVEEPDAKRVPKVPLHLVVAGCPSLKSFFQGGILHWRRLLETTCQVRPAMGISASAKEGAQLCLGPEQASFVVVAMLERLAEIKSPVGYLLALSPKAAADEFLCGPMVMALMPQRNSAL